LVADLATRTVALPIRQQRTQTANRVEVCGSFMKANRSMEPITLLTLAKQIAPAVIQKGAAHALGRYLKKKEQEAFEELTEAVRAGHMDLVDAAMEHDLAHALWKYFCAARDGAARRNLRMMARAIAGLLEQRRLFADDFDRYAPTLTRLTELQIQVLVTLTTAYDAALATGVRSQPHKKARAALDLLPSASADPRVVEGTLWELVGLGLLLPRTGGHMLHSPSPLAHEIIELSLRE